MRVSAWGRFAKRQVCDPSSASQAAVTQYYSKWDKFAAELSDDEPAAPQAPVTVVEAPDVVGKGQALTGALLPGGAPGSQKRSLAEGCVCAYARGRADTGGGQAWQRAGQQAGWKRPASPGVAAAAVHVDRRRGGGHRQRAAAPPGPQDR